MKIKFIGTGSGKTSLNQFHSSLLLISKNYNLLVDAGDGISRALLFNEIEFNIIDGILLTHFHPDHFSGLATLIVQMKMMNRKNTLDIFIHESLKNVTADFLLHSYLIPERMNFEMQYRTFNDNERIIISKNFIILAKKNSHLTKLQKYKSNYPSLSFYSASFLFEAEQRKIIYTSDIGSIEDLLLFNGVAPDILITETTHLNNSELIEAITKIKARKVYLTHHSDDDLNILSEILATMPPQIQKLIVFANDGLSLEI